jgi:hypothetical protein
MNESENDILFTNAFIKTGDTKIHPEYQEEFKEYYKKTIDTGLVQDTIITVEQEPVKRYIREVKTLVSVDSRDRNIVAYPSPNNFKIFLGRTFYNTRSIRLASIEFPNTNAVINRTNNKIVWINQEDIDDNIIDTVTQSYPLYSVELRVGSYIASKLQAEIISKMNAVKRRNRTGDFHFFDVTLDVETDVVSFTSLILRQLAGNPFTTISGTGIINVSAVAHGYANGDIIYIVGARQVSGISSTLLNGPHEIIVVNDDMFQFEIQTKASGSDEGGGSNVKSGRLAPFQLLFGDSVNTVAPNIGYFYENSSQQIVTNIKSVNNLYQVQISLTAPHNLNRQAAINTTVSVADSGTSPNIDGTRVITEILSATSILVSVNAPIDIPSFNSGTVVIDTVVFDISGIENFKSKTVLIETFTPHNYTFSSIGGTIALYDTTTKPSFDGQNTIFSVMDTTRLVLFGELLVGGSVNTLVPGEAGYTPTYNPLTSVYRTITAAVPGVLTTFTVQDHQLRAGDKIKLYNIFATPTLLDRTDGVHTVFSVIDSNTFTIGTQTSFIEQESIDTGAAQLGTGILHVTFPSHSMNTIVSITNDTPGNVLVQTLLAHNFASGDRIRIMQSNTVPSIDEGDYAVSVVSADSFTIPFANTLSQAGTYGIIGMSLVFMLYGASGIGGFPKDVLNNTDFFVRDILDENAFTFMIPNYYSTFQESGGGTNLFINSFFHGFNGVQTNTKNGVINRSISLEGENYSFLTSPQLGTMMNTGKVTNVFARITLDQSPGAMVFNFLSNAKKFDVIPLDKLEELQFSMVNYDGTLYEFNDLDYSFVLEITEILDTSENFNKSSKRGFNDTA